MKAQINDVNARHLQTHQDDLDYLETKLRRKHVDVEGIIDTLSAFQVAIPSWALGAGGTRFGRFAFGGAPATLEQKIGDVGILHALTGSAGAISLHIPWDVPEDPSSIKELAASKGLVFDAVNSNTFQDQRDQEHSYRYGSLCHEDKAVRQQAVDHNIEVIKHGVSLGSKSITVWLSDGSNFPGQLNFRRALQNTQESLHAIYAAMPSDWKIFIEYKPYEPNFYSTVIQDWGTSFLLANECGDRAFTLVDLGHHLPNTNIEQIVSTLMSKGKLGGFHFNDSKYGDDDLTVGCIKPYQLFLIFNELVFGMANNEAGNPDLAWMIDASHNIKDPLEDLIQSLEAIMIAYAKALLVDQDALKTLQSGHDTAGAQQLLQDAFRTDVRPLVEAAMLKSGAAIRPLDTYRQLDIRASLIEERGVDSMATGL